MAGFLWEHCFDQLKISVLTVITKLFQPNTQQIFQTIPLDLDIPAQAGIQSRRQRFVCFQTAAH